jgi:sirohydrochlorin ferrochelatase
MRALLDALASSEGPRARERLRVGVAIFAHGSSVPSANDAVRAVADRVASLGGFELVEAAFLEGGSPDLAAAVRRLIDRGASRILVVPYFLTLGLHLQRDLPRIVAEISSIEPGVEIHVAPPLDGHPAMTQALIERAREGVERWDATADDGETSGID